MANLAINPEKHVGQVLTFVDLETKVVWKARVDRGDEGKLLAPHPTEDRMIDLQADKDLYKCFFTSVELLAWALSFTPSPKKVGLILPGGVIGGR